MDSQLIEPGDVVICNKYLEYGEGICTLYSTSNDLAFIVYAPDAKQRYHVCALEDVVFVRKSTEEDRNKYATKRNK